MNDIIWVIDGTPEPYTGRIVSGTWNSNVPFGRAYISVEELDRLKKESYEKGYVDAKLSEEQNYGEF